MRNFVSSTATSPSSDYMRCRIYSSTSKLQLLHCIIPHEAQDIVVLTLTLALLFHFLSTQTNTIADANTKRTQYMTNASGHNTSIAISCNNRTWRSTYQSMLSVVPAPSSSWSCQLCVPHWDSATSPHHGNAAETHTDSAQPSHRMIYCYYIACWIPTLKTFQGELLVWRW